MLSSESAEGPKLEENPKKSVDEGLKSGDNLVSPSSSGDAAPTTTNSGPEIIESHPVPDDESGGLFGFSSSWYSSILQQAKEKTLSTYELVKRDIDEFSTAVQSEASHLASATTTVIRDQASNIGTLLTEPQETSPEPPPGRQAAEKPGGGDGEDEEAGWEWPTAAAGAGEWMSSLVKTVNKVLAVEDTTVGEEKMQIPITSDTFTRAQARLFAIQSDVGTYCNEPEGAPELFDDWLDHFSLDEHKDKISELLGMNPQMRTQYAQLVPSHVNNATFWQRYFYKIHQFELDEARREALLKRSEKDYTEDTENTALNTSWGDSEGETESEEVKRSPPVSEEQPIITKEPETETPHPSIPEKETPHPSIPETETPRPSIPETETPKTAETEITTPTEGSEHHSSENGTDTWSVCSNKDMTEIPDSPPTTDAGSDIIEEVDQSAGHHETTPTPTPSQSDEKLAETKGERTGRKKDEENDEWIDWDSD